MLNGKVSSKSRLTILKNTEGLKFPSEDFILICRSTEKIIRANNSLFSKNIYHTLVTKTLQILPKSIFISDSDETDHVSEQEFLYDHRTQLIYLVVQTYIDKRLKHETVKLCHSKNRVRIHNNKMTIFSGQ